MKKKELTNLILSAMFTALCFVLPFLTGQIPEIGAKLTPMHIPVLLCGFICGWKWGLMCGIASPVIRSLILGMPPIFPSGVCMAIELAVYGVCAGLLYEIFPRKKPFIYASLLISMVVGRIIWGVAMYICMTSNGNEFGLYAFFTRSVVNAIPGIIAQIILVPVLVMVWEKFRKTR